MEEKLVLVGVGHVFDISTQIKEIIDAIDPDAVALELDKNRLQFLLSPVKNKKSPNFLYFVLSKIQEKIAKKYGVITGSEMLSAATTAKDKGIDILCIDKDARVVIGKLWKAIPLKRKILFLVGSLSSIFVSKRKVEKELSSFEEEPEFYLDQVGGYFPEFKKILIDERNEFMCNKLIDYLNKYNTIVAFVGEGHITGLQKLIGDRVPITIIHLQNLRENNWRDII